MLRRKEQQLAEAMEAVLGLSLTAVAQPTGTPEGSGPFNAGPPPMPPVTPGQRFDLAATFVNRSDVEVREVRISIESAEPYACA